jgi:hypothetical protein
MAAKEWQLVYTNIRDLIKRQPDWTNVEMIEKATTEISKK